MITVIVTSRPQIVGKGDYHAQIKDKPQVWANGWTVNEAIGNLVRTHGDQFNIPNYETLMDIPDLTHEDIGSLIQADPEKFGIEIKNLS